MYPGVERILTLSFGAGCNEANHLGQGWSDDEAGFRWMIGETSQLSIENPATDRPMILELDFGVPVVCLDRRPQRLAVAIQDTVVARISVAEEGTVGFYIPANLLPTRGPLRIGFLHPDYRRPIDFGQETDDRALSLMVRGLRLSSILARSDRVREHSLPHAQMIRHFESLGDNCEFGFVHRQLGAEPLGLFRFASVPLAQLLRGLRTAFDGLGGSEHLRIVVEVGSGEYIVQETGYEIAYHTQLFEHQMNADVVQRQQRIRLHTLRRKLLEDLASGSKICVIKRTPDLRLEEVLPLFAALNELGQTRLLFVVLADEAHPSGTVEIVLPGLVRGHVDRFAPVEDANELSLPAWTAVCDAAWGAFG
jgi:hypothetical protein